MLGLVVEGAVGDDDVGLVRLGGIVHFWVVGAGHDVRQLRAGLPELVLLGDLFCVRHDVAPWQLLGLWTPRVVDLVAGVRVGVDRGVLLLLLLDDAAASEDVETCLGLGEDLAVLVFFEADVFLLGLFLGGFGLVD